MRKFLLLILITITGFRTANGQNILKGKVFEDQTRIALTDIQVQNVTNKEVMITDNNGKFTIKAKVGDILIF